MQMSGQLQRLTLLHARVTHTAATQKAHCRVVPLATACKYRRDARHPVIKEYRTHLALATWDEPVHQITIGVHGEHARGPTPAKCWRTSATPLRNVDFAAPSAPRM